MAVSQRLGDPALAQRAADAFLQGMSMVLLVCAGLAVVGAVLIAVFMPSRPIAHGDPDGEESAHELAGIA
jgi:hypothetical protein